MNEQEFIGLYHLERKGLIGLAKKHTGDVEIAHEIVQESFAQLWQKDRENDFELKHAKRLILRIVRTKAIDFLRISGGRKEKIKLISVNHTEETQDRARREGLQIRAVLLRSVFAMNSRHQEIATLRYLSGKTTAEIAATIGIHERTVREHLENVNKILRQSFEQEGLTPRSIYGPEG